MENSRNIETAPMGFTKRLRRIAGFVFNHLDTTLEPHLSSHWKPSKRVDEGKTEAQARSVQLVIAPIQEYGGQLKFTQPEDGVGYTDRDFSPFHGTQSRYPIIERTEQAQLPFTSD